MKNGSENAVILAGAVVEHNAGSDHGTRRTYTTHSLVSSAGAVGPPLLPMPSSHRAPRIARWPAGPLGMAFSNSSASSMRSCTGQLLAALGLVLRSHSLSRRLANWTQRQFGPNSTAATRRIDHRLKLRHAGLGIRASGVQGVQITPLDGREQARTLKPLD